MLHFILNVIYALSPFAGLYILLWSIDQTIREKGKIENVVFKDGRSFVKRHDQNAIGGFAFIIATSAVLPIVYPFIKSLNVYPFTMLEGKDFGEWVYVVYGFIIFFLFEGGQSVKVIKARLKGNFKGLEHE